MAILVFTAIPLFFDSYNTPIGIFAFFGRDIFHRIGAIFLMIASLIHFSKHILKLRESFKSQIFPTVQDLKDFILISLNWFKLRKNYPKIGFHHPAEKMIYWGTAVFGILLTGFSGLILWFPELAGLFSWIFGTGISSEIVFFTWMRIIHDIGFIIITVSMVAHIMLAVNTANISVLKAMFGNGKVPADWASKHHPGWKIEPILFREKTVSLAVNVGVKGAMLLFLTVRVALTLILFTLIFSVFFV
jgi:cytochrome b subunit of formate dehydrogenase